MRERKSEVKAVRSADEMWDLEILEEREQEIKDRNQERALWFMQRLGPRIKAKQRQLLIEDAELQEDLRVTPLKLKTQENYTRGLSRIEEV